MLSGVGASRISMTWPSTLGPPQQPGRAGQVVRAEDHVDPADLLLDQLPVLLGQATAHGDLQARLGVDQCLEAAQGPVELLVGVLPDAAGVEHHDVGLAHVVGLLHAVGHEHAGQALGVVLVHLAPERADDEGLGHLDGVYDAPHRSTPDRRPTSRSPVLASKPPPGSRTDEGWPPRGRGAAGRPRRVTARSGRLPWGPPLRTGGHTWGGWPTRCLRPR